MKLYLIRHGQTNHNLNNMFYGWTDCDINEKGIRQANVLRDFFKNIPYDAVYASDLLRAIHTAKIITDNKDMEIHSRPCFRELYYGDWEDVPFQYIKENKKEEFEHWQKNWKNLGFPNGENFQDFYKRVSEGIDTIISENKGKTVMVVAHNGTLSVILSHLIGAGQDAFWRFNTHQGCYNSLFVSGERITVEYINRPVHEDFQ